jgi:hypothetical protein
MESPVKWIAASVLKHLPRNDASGGGVLTLKEKERLHITPNNKDSIPWILGSSLHSAQG